jgi:hypothetical protein
LRATNCLFVPSSSRQKPAANLTNLPTRRAIEAQPRAFRGNRSANGGIEPKIVVCRVPRVPDTDDALGLPRGLCRDSVAGSLFDHVQAALVGAHVRIMRACGHRSSYHYWRSALPTFADYPVGMRKPIRCDGDRKSKPAAGAHNEVAHTAESALPSKKPPAPSVRHRLKRPPQSEVAEVISLRRQRFNPSLK